MPNDLVPSAPSPVAALPFSPARTLIEVTQAAEVRPLPPGDSRYLDLTPGHGSMAMAELRYRLKAMAVAESQTDGRDCAKIVFTGHRGSGKTTELLRIEQEFADRYFPIHLYLDENLRKDFDFALMFLSLAHSLAVSFAQAGMPLPDAAVEAIGLWFADNTQVDTRRVQDETRKKAEAAGQIGTGIFGLGLRLLAQVVGEASTSVERRQTISNTLKRYAGDLIEKVNTLLLEGEIVLRRHGRPPRLLVVQDNLDRLEAKTARELFFDNGDLIKKIRATCVLTAPMSLTLAPSAIGTIFPLNYNLPMIKVADKDGAEYPAGLDTLKALVGKRVDLAALFDREATVETLCRYSGGSVRDLMRLLMRAADTAAVRGLERIDASCAERAVATLRVEFQGVLRPERYFFPRLAAIHQTKSDGGDGEGPVDAAKAEEDRAQLGQLLFNSSVLEYNGSDSWFDVHPIVRDLKAFKDALAQRRLPPATA